MKGAFTKSGQPIQGRKYTLRQGDLEIPVTVVGKAFGEYGSKHLVAVFLEDDSGNREVFPWPLKSTDPDTPVDLTPGWPE